ncbi:MAG: TrmH family RNA methyltransferase [Planctomycetota bacterium]
MLTRCPNPKCKLQFDVPPDREGKNGPCPQCGQVITFRSLAILNEVERQQQRLLDTRLDRSDRPAEAPRFSALLEDIRSLWNVGAMFRSADGSGFDKLYLCGITGCPPRKEIAKTSLGAEDVVAWEHHTGALDVLPGLEQSGTHILALEKNETSIPLHDALRSGLLKAPLCMVMGNEVSGVSAEALGCATTVCHLPMRGAKTSLNVAVAFGIASYLIREYID